MDRNDVLHGGIESPVKSRQRPAGRGAACAAGLFAAAAAGFAVVDGAAAQEDAADTSAEVRNCVNLMQIDRTEVVDDDTILFYMKGGDVYRNDLPNKCPALAHEDTFMYRVALTQLCSVDVITVLSDVGFGFMPMASCGLGKFAPISDEEAEESIEAAAAEKEAR
jgi:hypothetical protein